MNPETRLFIDGELVDAKGGATYPNINPATEEAMGEVADAASEDMERAIAAARRAFDETDWPSNHALRLKCLQQLKDALVAGMDDCREQIASETGAPLGICRSGGPHCDVPIGFIDYTLEALPNFEWSRDIGIAEPMGLRGLRGWRGSTPRHSRCTRWAARSSDRPSHRLPRCRWQRAVRHFRGRIISRRSHRQGVQSA